MSKETFNNIAEWENALLLKGKKRGIKKERERIIELLWDWGMQNLSCQSKYEELVELIRKKPNE